MLDEHAAGTTRTKSDFEEVVLALCRQYGLPQPVVNQVVEGYEVDFMWAAARVNLEAAALETAGWRVIRVTWRRLTQEPAAVAAQLARLLGCEWPP